MSGSVHAPWSRAKTGGFTLVELLVTIAIIGALTALFLGSWKTVLNRAAMVREMGAARTLVTAYSSYASDNDGHLLAAYDMTAAPAQKPDGTVLSGPEIWRYPWRLAPYFSYDMMGTCLVNANTQNTSGAGSDYYVSCFPALGINYVYVGGTIQNTGAYSVSQSEVATRVADARSLLVFASAAGSGSSAEAAGLAGSGTSMIPGFCKLDPPATTEAVWSTAQWTTNSSPSRYGNVDARYNGRAVCAFLDGSVRMMSVTDLRNMCLWSKNADAQNNPNYMIASQSGGRIR